jgi:hypothetical protein
MDQVVGGLFFLAFLGMLIWNFNRSGGTGGGCGT